ncbi:LolA-like protein [Taibaiella koreensis]|uniref:hypothetical protein n=1 Tax=Taibaiella koreensis TaxID=1268548 RepID=UPI000E5A0AF8|nr:hypothetical protein [Taibaiella koreensis]
MTFSAPYRSYKLLGTLLLSCWCSTQAAAQVLDTNTYFAPILIDEVIIKSSDNGFDIKDFIERIKNDTTFYKAFRSMHLVTYNAENDIRVFEKKGDKLKASLNSETKQIARNGCRTMNVLDEKVTGDFYNRKKEYNYYTAELYASLFFTKGKVCGEDNIVKGQLEQSLKGKGSLEKNKARLKQLMFNPGSRIQGIPLMGNKSAIFDSDIAKRYDFRLAVEDKNGVPCYRFEATPKKEYAGDVVYKQFKTWFRQSDYSIVSRDYALAYSTLAYDFDVVIHVDLQQKGDLLLPTYISYKGNWYAFTKGREKVSFTAKFDY